MGHVLRLPPMRLRTSDVGEIVMAVASVGPPGRAVLRDADGQERSPTELRELSDAALETVTIALETESQGANGEVFFDDPGALLVRLSRRGISKVQALPGLNMENAEGIADLIVKRGRRLFLRVRLWALFGLLAAVLTGPPVWYAIVERIPWPLAVSGTGVLLISVAVLFRWYAETVVDPERRVELLGVWIDPRPIEEWRLEKLTTMRSLILLVAGGLLTEFVRRVF
jgi:hypothetical protein